MDTFHDLFEKARRDRGTYELTNDLAIGAALLADDMLALEKNDLGLEAVNALRAIVTQGWVLVDSERLGADERREAFATLLKQVERVMHTVSSRESLKAAMRDTLKVRSITMGTYTKHLAERSKVSNPDLFKDFADYQIRRYLDWSNGKKSLTPDEVADHLADTYTEFAREYSGGAAASTLSPA